MLLPWKKHTFHRYLGFVCFFFPFADLHLKCGTLLALILVYSHMNLGITFQASRSGLFNCNFLWLHDLFISGCTQKSSVSLWSPRRILLALKFHKPPCTWQVAKLTRVIRQGKKKKKKEAKHAEVWSEKPPELQAFQKCSTQFAIEKGVSVTILAL